MTNSNLLKAACDWTTREQTRKWARLDHAINNIVLV